MIAALRLEEGSCFSDLFPDITKAMFSNSGEITGRLELNYIVSWGSQHLCK